MQILDTLKEEDDKVNEAINESHPDEPAPQFNDITYQQIDVEILISEPKPTPPLKFCPLNFLQRKTIATKIFCPMWDKILLYCPVVVL